MLPIIPKPPITPRQKGAALAVAGTVDLLQIVLLPTLLPGYALDTALDILAAIILIAVCGFKWQFIVAFVLELFPVVDIFPTWTALVLTLSTGARTPGMVQAQRLNVTVSVPPPVPPDAGKGVVDVEAMAVPPVQPRTLSGE